ncbi:MAG: helix-turn-helix domain-containing protein [Armatimonadota bacterium]|jgi:mannose-6-phosphate isomerase-like protein (cupin superfamily)
MSKQLEQIGRRVAELREIEGLSPEALAGQLGIPVELYRRYERGAEDIPVGVLIQISAGFGVELTALLTGEEPKLQVFSVARAGEGVVVDRRTDYDYEALAYNFVNKKCEPFLVTVEPESDPSLNSHPGQEFDYVLEGRMQIVIDGHEIVLEAGDCVYFDAGRPHVMRALDDRPARFLAVIA